MDLLDLLPVLDRVPANRGSYRSSTTKTSPRQLVPMVQVVAPASEPNVPIQSEEKANHFPSCETLPIAYWVLKFCADWVLLKL
jgi:hypothetical protein